MIHALRDISNTVAATVGNQVTLRCIAKKHLRSVSPVFLMTRPPHLALNCMPEYVIGLSRNDGKPIDDKTVRIKLAGLGITDAEFDA